MFALRCLFVIGLVFSGALNFARAEVLIVADEFPAMEVLAAKLKAEEHIDSKLIWQTNLPPSLSGFAAVVVYIHRDLTEQAEDAFIHYAQSGGKLVVLHHSISSGKRKNRRWFPFLGVALPEGDLSHGGYKWIEGVNLTLVDLNPNHFIMTNKVIFPERIAYTSTNAPSAKDGLPAFTLAQSEVYLNHVHTGPHTLLMGVKYVDARSGVTYMQDHAGWIKPAGKGWVVYWMPGHTKHDFENPTYRRIVLNSIVYQPLTPSRNDQ